MILKSGRVNTSSDLHVSTLDHPVPPSPTFWTLEWPYLFHLQHIHYISVWQDTYFVLFKLLIKFFSLSCWSWHFPPLWANFRLNKAIINTNLSSMWTFPRDIFDRKLLLYNINSDIKSRLRQNLLSGKIKRSFLWFYLFSLNLRKQSAGL